MTSSARWRLPKTSRGPHLSLVRVCTEDRRREAVHPDDVRCRHEGSATGVFQYADAYPELGTKPVNETWWTDHVLDGHKTFVANDIDAIAEVFPDHELIASLGCQSVINVPIIINGAVYGTINCLDEAGHYTPERVAASDALKLPGAAAFLLNKSI
jgi:GAF domain-containing protein